MKSGTRGRSVALLAGGIVFGVQFRIADACVVDILEALDEHLLGLTDVEERDRTVAEVAVGHLSVHQSVDEIRDCLLRILRL